MPQWRRSAQLQHQRHPARPAVRPAGAPRRGGRPGRSVDRAPAPEAALRSAEPLLGHGHRRPRCRHPGQAPGSTPRTWSAATWTSTRLAALLLDGRVGAVAQGRAEVGPRALCRRSIIAVPDTADVNTRVNVIKNREQWRPFAGVTRPAYGAQLWEQQEHFSRYMLGAARATELGRRVAPGVVHVDGTTRPQVLHGDEAPAVGAVLDSLERQGAPPVLLNTSFNDKGEPIVNTAADALTAFRSMDLDFLVLGDDLYRKTEPDGRCPLMPAGLPEAEQVPGVRPAPPRRHRAALRTARGHPGDGAQGVAGAALPRQRVRAVPAHRLGPGARGPDLPTDVPTARDAVRGRRGTSWRSCPPTRPTNCCCARPCRRSAAASTRTPPDSSSSTCPAGTASNSRACSTNTARRCSTSPARGRPATRTAPTASAGRSSSGTRICASRPPTPPGSSTTWPGTPRCTTCWSPAATRW